MKTAWIFPGGSARTVYTAGSLYALCEMPVQQPDIIIGGSGSAGTCMCYVSGQKEIIKEIWCKSLSTKKFLSFWRFWKILNVDYLVDTVLKKENPLNMEKITKSPILTFLVVTNSISGEIEYISNKDGVDMYEVMRAAVSVPIWTNLFSVMGTLIRSKFYSDSPPASRFQIHVKKAMYEGAERIVIFDNWHPDDNPTGFLYAKIYTYFRNKEYKKRQLAYLKEIENFSPPQNIELIYLHPSKKLAMSRFEIDNVNANKIFSQGYSETINNNLLKKLV